MRDVAIRVERLGKCYTVNGRPFWPIRDIDLTVRRGEVLGIVGRNGAGKTTLLRILGRITEPSEGRATLCGRIGTLLETGTGFHDDLSGRENVYLNGAILGMHPHEVGAKFDEIVEFAGVLRFIDAPVKSYSSGMRTRLAFSIAAHLDTEILLVDEVLAVGDLAFQEKCMRKMDELTQGSDRTVLFVSHNMGAIHSICDRAILLEEGRVHREGEPLQVTKAYRDLLLGPDGQSDLSDRHSRPGTGTVRITKVRLENLEGKPLMTIPAGAGVRLVIDYENLLDQRPKDVLVSAVFVGARGVRLFGTPSDVVRADLSGIGRHGSFVCTLPRLPLLPGLYELILSCLVDRQLADKLERTISVAVEDSDYYGTGRLQGTDYGEVLVDYEWSLGRSTVAGQHAAHS